MNYISWIFWIIISLRNKSFVRSPHGEQFADSHLGYFSKRFSSCLPIKDHLWPSILWEYIFQLSNAISIRYSERSDLKRPLVSSTFNYEIFPERAYLWGSSKRRFVFRRESSLSPFSLFFSSSFFFLNIEPS